mmetsp:Transcript_52325/g.124904  ORF Transcript_52325/g.124904 Transcript_52325/m.124904 type:complete len:347 (-) Transcript_52325:31-1071(-)
MDSKGDGNSFESLPPPVGGLGNYKGVMLCTRPTAESRPPIPGADGADGKPPFRPPPDMMASEPWGLAPPIGRRLRARDEVKTHGPSAALRRHVQWLKELQVQVKADQKKFEDEELKDVDKKKRSQEVFRNQRDAVRLLKKDGNMPSRKDVEAVLLNKKPAKAAAAAGQKPLWAMTAPEKDEFEEEEALDLINFADELDYEKYIGDLEFRQCLGVLRDRAKRLQKEQDSFKDALLRDMNGDDEAANKADEDGDDALESASVVGELGLHQKGRRVNVGSGKASVFDEEDRPDWDTSTNCGDERQSTGGRDLRSAAGQLLEAAPHLKAVHSKESMQRIIEKSKVAETAA